MTEKNVFPISFSGFDAGAHVLTAKASGRGGFCVMLERELSQTTQKSAKGVNSGINPEMGKLYDVAKEYEIFKKQLRKTDYMNADELRKALDSLLNKCMKIFTSQTIADIELYRSLS